MTEPVGGSVTGGGASNTGNEEGLRAAAALLQASLDQIDAVAAGKTKDGVSVVAASGQRKAAAARTTLAASSANSEDKSRRRRRPPQRDGILALVADCKFWHGADSGSYVTFTNGDRTEHAAVRAPEFTRWLRGRAWRETGEVPGSQAIEDALRIIECQAHEGPEQEPWLRVGGRGGRLFIDLCDADRTYIDVSVHGAQLCTDGLAPFVRSAAMRPLCEPSFREAGAGIDVLREFVNVEREADFVLVVAWLLGALRPSGPYPILVVGGQQGAGKSTFSKILRCLVDPNSAPIRAAPKDGRDLIVAASNCHVQCFDNLSKVDNDLSDAFCRLATGGGFSTRQLHTDRDEMIFFGQRPVLLNGIPALAERADLADRCIGVRLTTLDESTRRTEADLWEAFERAAPDILSALLDAMVAGLRNLPTTRLDRPPRLADFATWIVACEPGLGWAPGTFIEAFAANRRDVNASAFEADSVAVAIRDLIREDRPRGWSGTPTELLGMLNVRVAEDIRKSRAWPFTAQALGSRVDRAAPLLRGQGLVVERRHSGSRFITIAPIESRHDEEGATG